MVVTTTSAIDYRSIAGSAFIRDRSPGPIGPGHGERAMILEAALLDLRDDTGETAAAFEAAFRQAAPLIASSPGYRSLTLQRRLDAPGRYLLLVGWDTVEDHTIGFRQSPAYQEWKALLHHFYDPFPVVEHFEQVDLTTTKASPHPCP
jgi:heme-degrading monooxygenase HmoA